MLIKNAKAIFDIAADQQVDIGVGKSMFIAQSDEFQALSTDEKQEDSDSFDAFIRANYDELCVAYRAIVAATSEFANIVNGAGE